MKNDNFYKTLRIICLILAIVCMALSLFKKAKAEEITVNNLKEYYKSLLNPNNTNNYDYDSLLDFETFPYTFMLKNQDGVAVFMWKFDNYVLKAMNDGNLNDSFKWTTYMFGGSGNNDQIAFRNAWSRNGNNSVGRILIYDSSQSPTFVCADYYATDDPKFNSANAYCWASGASRQITNIPYNKSRVDQYIMSSTRSSDIYIPDDITVHYCGYGTYNSGSTYKGVITENMPNVYNIKVNNNNTEGFEVYKYGASGSERLVCDFSQCISISNAVSNSSTIQIDITIDGIDHTFNFDSSSTYYDYSVSSSRAIYSFPLTIFGINSETIYAKLSGINVVNITSSPGGSNTQNIVWVTPLTLVGSDYEDVEPEVIPKEQMPDFDYFDDEDTQTSYNGTMNRWLTSSYSTFDYSLFTRWNFEPKYLVIGVEPYNASKALKDSLADFIRAIGNLEFGNALAEAITIGQGKTLQEQITEYLNDHLYITDLYDIIVFGYLPSENGTMQYYIYTTDSYNNHLNNSLIYDLLQAVSDDGKAIEKTYDYLYDRLNDFENKTLTKLNEMVGLQELENGFISSLQSILNQILNALLNLNIEIPEADYSSITSRLDQIISNQGNGNLNNDWYDNYRSWLYGKDSTDNIISPHEFFIDIFDPIKNTYAAFIDTSNIAGYIADMDLFVEYLSGKIDDNLSIYFKDGIGSSSFDINNNNMLTVGGT